MKITCTSCHREIPASDIDIRSKMAKCAACNNVFDFSDQVPSSGGGVCRESLGIPKNVEVNYIENGLQIVRRWFSPVIVFLTLFCCFWDGFMIVWFTIAIREGQWAMAAFGTIHGLVGVGLTYFVICGYLNRTYVTISYDALSIVHKPLPAPGQKTVNRNELKQLYSKEKVHHGRNGTSYSYDVMAITHGGQTIKLLAGLDASEQALFIEQEIEKYLGIRDEAVRGEIRR
jgi:hypothetical protein